MEYRDIINFHDATAAQIKREQERKTRELAQLRELHQRWKEFQEENEDVSTT